MLHEAEKNVLYTKLLVFNVLAAIGSGNEEFRGEVMDTWHRYLSLSYGMPFQSAPKLNEQSMLEEYEKMKNLRPEFKIEKDGKITIKGFENFVGKNKT